MTILTLEHNWRLVRTQASEHEDPETVDWNSAVAVSVPSTVGSAVAENSQLANAVEADLDASDWWYQTEVQLQTDSRQQAWLDFEGLATLAEVWLNGEKLLTSNNMFRRHLVDVRNRQSGGHMLTIAFRSVSNDLSTKRPRGRWKTQLVGDQQLRWIRTSLLGRIPGWTPPTPAIGPWRPITLHTGKSLSILTDNSWTTVTNGHAILNVDVQLADDPASPESQLIVELLGQTFELPIDWQNGVGRVQARLDLDEVPLWYPHTHGPAERVKLAFYQSRGSTALAERMICFREIRADRSEGGFSITVNRSRIFCRGGCWTIGDIRDFGGSVERLRSILTTSVNAGLNMIRVGGTMTYESDAFYALCDELGILVWQDFMFASLDYPVDNEDFLDNVKCEVEQQARRLRRFGSVAVFCGSSETEQQAAMVGKNRETWEHPLFRTQIPAWLEELGVEQPYVPSSPCDGPLPMHNAVGISHYFGVGAYLQGIDDLDRSRVRFATECLAFANVPSDYTLKKRFGGPAPAVHTPTWKAGVPRDSGTGWDFEDVRDHYLRELYGVDPVTLRYENNARYMYLSSVASGEVMARTYDRWRTDSRCCGALVWFLNDIRQGAGWGLIDSDARAKPALEILRESWQPVAIDLRDRGMDGMSIAIHNAEKATFQGQLRVRLFADSRRLVSDEETPIQLDQGQSIELALDEILGTFSDHLHRHRFGPRRQDTISVRLIDEKGELTLSRQRGLCESMLLAPDCTVNVTREDSEGAVIISSDRALRRVRLSSPNADFAQNYFDLLPNENRRIEIRRQSGDAARGTVSAVNWLGESYFRC